MQSVSTCRMEHLVSRGVTAAAAAAADTAATAIGRPGCGAGRSHHDASRPLRHVIDRLSTTV